MNIWMWDHLLQPLPEPGTHCNREQTGCGGEKRSGRAEIQCRLGRKWSSMSLGSTKGQDKSLL